MKKTWKIMCIAIIAVLIAILIINNSTSASGIGVEVASNSVNVGDDIVLTVRIESDDGISGAQGDITFDETNLQYKGNSNENNDDNALIISQAGDNQISFFYYDETTEKTEINFTITLTAIEEIDVTLIKYQNFGFNGETISINDTEIVIKRNPKLKLSSDSDYLDSVSVSLKKGENATIISDITITDWTSSDANVATVTKVSDTEALVTAVEAGEVTITATSENGSATATVNVTAEETPTEELAIDQGKQITLKVGEETQLTANQTVTGWDANPSGIVTVDDSGYVKAVATGTTTITATSDNGTATIAVIVEENQPVDEESPILTISSSNIEIGGTAQITEKSGKIIKSWNSDNTGVATVDENGKVTGVSAGTATITATAENGKTATIKVTVNAKQEEIKPVFTLSETNISIKIGDTTKIINAYVNNTDYTSIANWTSSDINIVHVDKGCIVPISLGTTTIKATTEVDGVKLEATATVTIVDGTNPIVNPSGDISLTVGQIQQMTADRAVTWVSGNGNVATITSTTEGTATITATGAGTTTITATDINGKSTSFKVIVTEQVNNNDGNGNAGTGTENSTGTGTGTGTGSSAGTTATGNGTTTTGNTSSSANTAVPATGESTAETLVVLGIVTLIVASVVFRRKSRLK